LTLYSGGSLGTSVLMLRVFNDIFGVVRLLFDS